jgi:uncharacterized protein
VNFETVPLTTVDGISLTADVAGPDVVTMAVVVAHPHPLYGGDRHNHVVSSLWRRLATLGACSLRFDFRGAGSSGGRHEGGVGEQLDVMAALDEVTRRHGEVPVWLVGYSFGAMVVAEVTDPRLTGWVLIAPPLGYAESSTGSLPPCASDPRPTVVLVPQHDEFCPPSCIEHRCSSWITTRHEVIAHATHGLIAQGTAVADLVARACWGPTPAGGDHAARPTDHT